MAVLFITHDFGVVAEIADRVAVMQHGKLVEHGPAQQVLERAASSRTRARCWPRCPTSRRRPRAPRLRRDPVALTVERPAEGVSRPSGMLSRGGARRARRQGRGASRFAAARPLGIVGESGSGKSTVARCIARLVAPDAGEIRVGDIDFGRLSQRALRRASQAHPDGVPGSVRLARSAPDGRQPDRRGSDRSTAPPAEDARRRALELLALVGLDARSADRFPHEFSGGQRQRIGLARALALDPDVLIADEPVSALDVSVQAQVLRLLADIRERLGLSMLFITHDLRVAGQVCDSIAVMRHGEIVEFGRTESVFNAPTHPYTQTLFGAVPGRAWSLRRSAALREQS